MFETYLASSELVLFWDKEGVEKTMVYSDFQATLDGMVGINGYERQERRAAYVELNDNLKVRACVLFTIGFDNAGFPERSWNLPLKHMAEIAGRGPDMGGGPINLVCRSQCSISWHAPKLWDPVMQPGNNSFEQIAAAVAEAAPRLGLKPSRRSSGIAPAFPATPAAESSEMDIPVLTDSEPVLLEVAADPAWDQERDLLMSRLAEQQLKISTLTNDKTETIARMELLHQQQLDILEAQNGKLLGQHRAMKEQSDVLREEVEALRHQISSLKGLEQNLETERQLHKDQLAAAMQAKAGDQTQKYEELLQQKELEFQTREARLQAEQQLALEQRIGEEAARFRAQMDALRSDLGARDEAVTRLTRELSELRTEQAKAQEGAADEFLHRLEALGMNFVVFHPGAGHVSVPVAELATYASNPQAYAAAKCLVSEEQYRSWLAHYESPRCCAPIGDNKNCEARLIRTDSPTKFIVGQSDRCARHQAADSAIDNVLRFR